MSSTSLAIKAKNFLVQFNSKANKCIYAFHFIFRLKMAVVPKVVMMVAENTAL